jgi:long-chain acyl-CoA synthetase
VNLAYLVARLAGETPGDPAVLLPEGGGRDWAQQASRVARFAGLLTARGAKTGDRVAVLAANGPDVFDLVLAAAWAGILLVPLNWRLAAAEIADQLADAEPVLLAHDAAHRSLAEAACWRGATLAFGAAHERAIAAAEPAPLAAVPADHPLGLYYTGGTTGRAKGVILAHANALANGRHIQPHVRFSRRDVHLHAAPMFHLADLGAMFGQLLGGGAHAFLPRFAPAEFYEAMARHRVSAVMLAPTMIAMALADPAAAQTHDLSAWRLVWYGGSPMSEPILRAGMAAWPCAFFQGYGQTEATHTICLMTPDDHRAALAEPALLASCGRPVAGVHVRVVDRQDRPVPPGAIGEIVVRGPTVMAGYWRRETETAAALAGGWLRTGDLARRDADGRVFIVDRAKDMIVTGAENVYSVEVEAALLRCPGVAEVAVVAVPDPVYGERVHAVIVPVPGARPEPAVLQAECRAFIAGYKVPRSFAFVAALPKSAAGKVQKEALRRPHWAGRARGVG